MTAEYDVSEEGFFKKARFGARWGDRSRVTRSANFSNWGNLGAPWTGRGGNWNCGDFQAFGCGGAYVKDFPNSSQLRNPFGDNFQRGNATDTIGQWLCILLRWRQSGRRLPKRRNPTAGFGDHSLYFDAKCMVPDFCPHGNLPGGPWTAGEISDVEESTFGAYARVDFGADFGDDITLNGNIGIRYVETIVRSGGSIGFPTGQFLMTRLPVEMAMAALVWQSFRHRVAQRNQDKYCLVIAACRQHVRRSSLRCLQAK